MNKCKITNGMFFFIMRVDGEVILFEGRNAAIYFAKHYEKLGYKVEWDYAKTNQKDLKDLQT